MKRHVNCLALVILLFICSIGSTQASQAKLLNTTTDTEVLSANIMRLGNDGICSFTNIKLGEYLNFNNCVYLLGEVVSVDGYPKYSIDMRGIEFKNGYIFMNKGRYCRIRVMNSEAVADNKSFLTVRGIGVGGKLDFLLKQYGQPNSIRDYIVNKIYRYENSVNYIEFEVDEELKQITSIELGFN